LSARVVVRHLTVLHGIFKRAMRKYGLPSNPASAALVERPKLVYTGEFDTFTGDEIELLATNTANIQDATIYRVAAFTGLRQGELLALRWGEVDFVGGLLHVRRNFTDGREKMPKGKRVRSVPMIPAVVDALARLKERGYLTDDADLIFCNTAGDHLNHWMLRRRYYDALDRAGLRKIRFHDLRHCFGSAAITKLTRMPCRATWATSTTRPRPGTCTTSPARRTPPRSMRRSAGTCPEPCPQPRQFGTN
jgi:integrase